MGYGNTLAHILCEIPTSLVDAVRYDDKMLLVLSIILVLLISAIFSSAMVLLARRWRGVSGFEEGTDDVEGVYVTVIGTIYAIMLAFMIFVVWTRHDAAENTVDHEANSVAEVYRLASGLTPQSRDALRASCREYVVAVTGDEWNTMRKGRASPRARAITNRMWDQVVGLSRSKEDSVLRDHLLTAFTTLTEARRYRIILSRMRVPPILWGELIFGFIILIGFSALFTGRSLTSHALKTLLPALIIAFTLYAIYTLDHPFSSMVRVPPDPLVQVADSWR